MSVSVDAMKTLINALKYTLTSLRIVSTALIVFVCYLLMQMWGFYQEQHTTLLIASGGAFATAWIALIGILGKCLNHLLEKNYKDDE